MARRNQRKRRRENQRGLALVDAGKPIVGKGGPDLTGIARSLAGKRATVEDGSYIPTSYGVSWIAPTASDEQWRLLDLDSDAIGRYSPHKILELLVDLSPDVSRALFDFLRLCNPDWTLIAYKPGTLETSPRAMRVLADIVDELGLRHGSIDHIFNRAFFASWLRGAIFIEPVFDTDGRTLIDIATPDPQTARFKRRDDPRYGQVWDLGQFQAPKGFVDLHDRPTVRYIPIDPLPGLPYGRSLASPAIFAALFFLGVLHDIRRVVAQQGYPRMDITIDFEKLQEAMPEEYADDPDKLSEWVRMAVEEVVKAYSTLQPDDAYVHASTITVNKPVGAVNADSLGGITGLISALERMLIKGLKTMPLLMGMADGVSEASANRQIEMHMMGIREIQRLVAAAFEWALGLALRAQGIRATLAFSFNENRAVEALRDEQVLQLKITNAVAMYQAGFASQDQASQHAIGRNADVPEPRGPQSQQQADVGLVNGSVKNPPAGKEDDKASAEPDKDIAKGTKGE